MASSLSQNKIGIDHRGKLYYNKYQYRAKLRLHGVRRTWYAKNLAEYKKRLSDYKSWQHSSKIENDNIDFTAIGRYITWRNKYFSPKDKKDKKVLVRIEGQVAAVFSNDLSILKELEKIDGPKSVEYSEVDLTIENGIKYFVREPKHKYRVYLKSRRVEDKFRQDLLKFINRYKGTDTVIVPGGSLDAWLKDKSRYQWSSRFCSSHYFIDFDDESTSSLIGIMFGDMIKARFKLEKRP